MCKLYFFHTIVFVFIVLSSADPLAAYSILIDMEYVPCDACTNDIHSR